MAFSWGAAVEPLVNEVQLGIVVPASALPAAAGVSFNSHEEQQEEDVYTELSA